MLKFTIPFLSPSVNKLYRSTLKKGKLIVYKTKQARDFVKQVSYILPKKRLKGRVILYMRFFICKSNILKVDLDNFEKVLIDALKNKIIDDDRYIFEKHSYKYEVEKKDDEFIEIEVIPLDASKSQNKGV